MSALTPAMETALAADRAIIFGAIEINLPTHDIRVLDGSGEVTFGGSTFTGEDETYGVLAAIDSLDDGVGDEAPGLGITFHPNSNAAAVDLSSPTYQGSRIRLWIGAIDTSTGAVVADPLLYFDGEIDTVELTVGRSMRSLDFECVSGFERFFENDEGTRLSDAYHQNLWPGELGLSNVTGITRKLYPGDAKAPSGTGGGSFRR